MASPDRQHRFRWETTWAVGAAVRASCAPAPGTTLDENDRPRDFPDRRPEVQNYPLGVPSTPVFGNISPVLAATALTRPAIPTKSRSPNMRVLTQPLTEADELTVAGGGEVDVGSPASVLDCAFNGVGEAGFPLEGLPASDGFCVHCEVRGFWLGSGVDGTPGVERTHLQGGRNGCFRSVEGEAGKRNRYRFLIGLRGVEDAFGLDEDVFTTPGVVFATP